MSLQCQRFLELGAGSGLIAVYAALHGARVTATDINPDAIDCLKKNARLNSVRLSILHSDLFLHIPEQQFDIIAINPPFYKKNPQDAKDYAWYAGKNGEYFESLFGDLDRFIHPGSQVFMVLFEGCDLQMILDSAARHHFRMDRVHTHRNLLEKIFIYKIMEA